MGSLKNFKFVLFAVTAFFLFSVPTDASSKDFIIKVYERISRPSFSLGAFRFLGNFSWNQKYTFIEHRDGLLVIPESRVCSLMYWSLGNSWKCQPKTTLKISEVAVMPGSYPAIFEKDGKVEMRFAAGLELKTAKAVIAPSQDITMEDQTDAYHPHILVTNTANGIQGAFPLLEAESLPHDHIAAQDLTKLQFRVEGIVRKAIPIVSILGRNLGTRWQRLGSTFLKVDAHTLCIVQLDKSPQGAIELKCDNKDQAALEKLKTSTKNTSRDVLGVFPFTVDGKVSQISLARGGGDNLESAVAAVQLGPKLRWVRVKNSRIRRTVIDCGEDCRIEVPDSAAAFLRDDVDSGKFTDETVKLSDIAKSDGEKMKEAPTDKDGEEKIDKGEEKIDKGEEKIDKGEEKIDKGEEKIDKEKKDNLEEKEDRRDDEIASFYANGLDEGGDTKLRGFVKTAPIKKHTPNPKKASETTSE